MIPMISFGSLAQWVVGAFAIGCLAGGGFVLWLYNRDSKKK
jgi:hypothetical protein